MEEWGRTPEEVLPGLSCPAKSSSYAGAASVGMEVPIVLVLTFVYSIFNAVLYPRIGSKI